MRGFDREGRAEVTRYRAKEGAVVPKAGWSPEAGSRGAKAESPILQEKQKPSIRAAFCFDDEEKGLFQLTDCKINFTPFPAHGHDVIESF